MIPRTPGAPGTLDLLRDAWRAGRGRFARALGLSVLLGAVEFSGLALLVPLLGHVGLDTGEPGRPVVEAFRAAGVDTLAEALVAFVLLATAGSLLERAHDLAAVRVAAGTSRSLRRRLHAALARSSWPWFSRLEASAASHALVEEAERAGASAQALLSAAAQGILALAYLVLALAASPGLSGPACVAGLVVLLAVFRIREARWRGEAETLSRRDLAGEIGDGMADARTERAHGGTEAGIARFSRLARRGERLRISIFRHLAGTRVLVTAGTAAVLAAFVGVSVGVLGTPPAVLLLSLFLLHRLVHRALAAVRHGEHAAVDLPGYAAVIAMTRSALAAAEIRPEGTPRPLRERLEFAGVSFSHGGPDRAPAVLGATFSIPAGALAVVAGPSGSGKTTLADLAAGVLAPDAGRILVDGAVPGAAWGLSVGYVAQDPLLLHGTVRSNLLRARPGAGEEEIRAALALAGAPGPDRETGERGQALSGGERRRVALARALLRRPSLLVVDGAADGPGAAGAAGLLEVIRGLRGRATVLLVSDREEASRGADVVVLMQRGRPPLVAAPREPVS